MVITRTPSLSPRTKTTTKQMVPSCITPRTSPNPVGRHLLRDPRATEYGSHHRGVVRSHQPDKSPHLPTEPANYDARKWTSTSLPEEKLIQVSYLVPSTTRQLLLFSPTKTLSRWISEPFSAPRGRRPQLERPLLEVLKKREHTPPSKKRHSPAYFCIWNHLFKIFK